jgi:DNA-binding beta-propeller fold protein YncE
MNPGQRLAQYEIVRRIGAGGMGEVYLARDTNLDRDVAVKVLPEEVADNVTHLARLEREAKAIAALSHPNILAVYDFGKSDGVAYVVTELLEGQTLRDRLSQGPMAPRKATELGRQIAHGLAAAHDKGIVHRDLKPENLFVTGEGRIKILDFGLATAPDERPGQGATVDLETRTRVTDPGTVLGTVDYMSPEQVRGEPTDNRSDVFSFGLVLYEMITGSRAFHRDTKAETMTAILKEEPREISSVVADVPHELAAIIRRCLEKHPGERFHSSHDLAFSIEALSGSSVSTGTVAAIKGVGGPRRRPGVALTTVLVVAALAVGAVVMWLLRPAPAPESPANFAALTARRGTVTNARFTGGSDDAAVYSAAWGGGPVRVYPVTPGAPISEPLSIGDADLLSVASTGEIAVSLDRRYPLGWEAIGTLAIVQPGGAAPRPVLENVLVADFAPDGHTLAVAHEVDGVVRLEYPIGTVLYTSEGWISGLRVNPDGERVLIADNPAHGDNLAIARVVHRDGRVETVGARASWGAVWAPDGETVWMANGGNVYRARPGNSPLTSLITSPVSLHLMDVSPSGRLLAAASTVRRELVGLAPGADKERDLSWLDWSTPRLLSDDGRVVVFEEGNDYTEDGYGIYMRRTDGAPPVQLGHGTCLALSPDGAYIAAVRRPFSDNMELVLLPTGAGKPRPVALHGLRVANTRGRWIPGDNGSGSLVLLARMGDGPMRLFRLPLDGDAEPVAITPADFPLASNGHRVSLDGRRVLARPAQGAPVEFSINGDGPRPVPGLLPTDLPIRFDRDGRHVYVQSSQTIPTPIYRVDTVTGERTLWRELSPRDAAGVFAVDLVRVSADGAAYIYSIRRIVSSLQLITGLD